MLTCGKGHDKDLYTSQKIVDKDSRMLQFLLAQFHDHCFTQSLLPVRRCSRDGRCDMKVLLTGATPRD